MTKRRSRRSIEKSQDKQKPKMPQNGSKVAGEDFAVLKVLSEQLINMKPGCFEESLDRILRESATLRDEPEFADLHFDPERTLEAAVQHFEPFKKRIRKAVDQDSDALLAVYDEYRFTVLEEWDTPEFRADLIRRLDRCKDRFMGARDPDKLEMSIFTSSALSVGVSEPDEEEVPLGAFGLVATIYEESFDRAMATIEDARDRIDGLHYKIWCGLRRQVDMEIIAAATAQSADAEQPDAFEKLLARVEAEPELTAAWDRQEKYLLKELETRVTQEQENFVPAPFDAEIKLAMDRMEERHLSKFWYLGRYFPLLSLPHLLFHLWNVLNERVTPQRIAEITETLQEIGQELVESDDKQMHDLVPHLVAAVRYPQDQAIPSNNDVVKVLFMKSILKTLREMIRTGTLSPRWQIIARRMRKRFR
jgi:hypothetical protein